MSEKYENFSKQAGHPKVNYSYFVFKLSLTVGSTVHGWDSPEKWLGLLVSPLSSLPYKSSIPHDRLSCHSVFSLVNIVKVMVIVSCLSLISSWLSLLFLCFSFVSWQFSSLVKIYHYGRNHIHLVKTMKYSQSYGHKHLSWSKLLNIVEAMVIIMKVGQCCEIWSKLFVKYIRIKYIC